MAHKGAIMIEKQEIARWALKQINEGKHIDEVCTKLGTDYPDFYKIFQEEVLELTKQIKESSVDSTIKEIYNLIGQNKLEEAKVLANEFEQIKPAITDFNQRVVLKLPLSYGTVGHQFGPLAKESELKKINYVTSDTHAGYIHKDVDTCIKNLMHVTRSTLAKDLVIAYMEFKNDATMRTYDDVLKEIINNFKGE